MHYMAQPISFRWDEDFIAAIDAARGKTKRSTFVRDAVERALDPSTPASPAQPSRSATPAACVKAPMAAISLDSSRGLNANGHLMFCICSMCKPPEKGKR